MAQTKSQKTHSFKTDESQILKLVIDSVYSHRDIFLRELISNASDACDKLKYELLQAGDVHDSETGFVIRVQSDADAKTLIISDNGIGMSEEEIIDHLGTIAKSGTKEFLSQLSGDKVKDSQMIGQFGIGFYASFMVADRVKVISRRAGLKADQAVSWSSEGTGEFTVEPCTKESVGTEIHLHIKDDGKEFLDGMRLRNVIKQYSNHICVPIEMPAAKVQSTEKTEGDDSAEVEIIDDLPTWERVNEAKALWTKARSELSDDEYKEFFKSNLTYDYSDPMTWIHKKVEGQTEYTSLLYIPSKAPFDLWDQERKSGIKLYIQRVFIMDNMAVLPAYLRFVKGIIDCNDLPLNVSRELLQNNKVVDKIRKACVKNVLTKLEKMAEKEPEQYNQFWDQFGPALKEGPAEDMGQTENLAKLYRFASTVNDQSTQRVSLDDYISRMLPDQKHIYYLIADGFTAAKNSPHLEMLRKKDIEVLLLSDRVDEWLMAYLTEYQGKTFQSINKGDLELPESVESKEDKDDEAEKLSEKEQGALVERVEKVLKDRVSSVKISHRLEDSPACVVADSSQMSMHLQRMMMAAGQAAGTAKPVFEINPKHALVEKVDLLEDGETFDSWVELLFEQALLADGAQLDDPAGYVKRVNRFLV